MNQGQSASATASAQGTDSASHRAIADIPLASLQYAVVDVETTGWSPEDAGITEIGAVRVRGGEIESELTSLVNPGTPVPEAIVELTGISDEMLALAPSVVTVMPGLLAFASDCVLIAHNARFDVSFLRAASGIAGLDWPDLPIIDTLRLARQLMVIPDEVPDCKLSTLASYFDAPAQPTHRALADARATAWVLTALLGRLADRGIYTISELTPWLEEREAEQAAAAAEAAAAEAAAAEMAEAEAAKAAAAGAAADAAGEAAAGAEAVPDAGRASRLRQWLDPRQWLGSRRRGRTPRRQ